MTWHITKDSSAARKLLCEAAWQATMRNPQAKAVFERVQHGDSPFLPPQPDQP